MKQHKIQLDQSFFETEAKFIKDEVFSYKLRSSAEIKRELMLIMQVLLNRIKSVDDVNFVIYQMVKKQCLKM